MQREHYTLAIEAKGDYLYVRSHGLRTRATVTAMTMEIFDAALAKALSKVLIDVRELEGRLGILDSYFVVTDVFQKLRGKGIDKAAIVDESVSPLRWWFLETVAVNRGFNLRIFADQQKALEWLKL
jgi:CHAD domain-containing protein